nr:putative oxidoreductase [uncultured Mediterranean phage uvMED]BAR25584.1 putative oxidoreductase [uncultured Mediterranean phage uvMED]
MKSRETIIDDGRTKIYNNIVYPKTGENLPSFGMDLMCFFEKKVIVVWDFQHPTPNYEFDHPVISYLLPDMYDNTNDDIRFFEPGNHFSRFVYVRKCTVDDIKKHLINFKRYVSAYEELLYFARPKETDGRVYKKFDQYMLDLDPVIGYMASKFGKSFSEDYVNKFLFSYADT